MIWQDIVFTVGSFIFSVALIPAIRAKEKPPLKTSLSTFLVLLAFVACYISLGFWVSAIFGSLTALCWFILFMQRLDWRVIKDKG